MDAIKDLYIHKKEVDWSVLNFGINIPVSLQVKFYNCIGQYLEKGNRKRIKIVIDGNQYDAILINQAFNEQKYPNHKELLQIRYTPKSLISRKLKHIYYTTYDYIINKRAIIEYKKQLIQVPKEIREYLVLYTTEFNDTFLLETITADEVKEIEEALNNVSEEDFESSINHNIEDKFARVIKKNKLLKIRQLNKSIGENLKSLYEYKCQICGNNFGKRYNTTIAESHHIESFVKTKNNDFDNILIVCPNHHRIIHKTNPLFHKKDLFFSYNNGLKERLMINRHL